MPLVLKNVLGDTWPSQELVSCLSKSEIELGSIIKEMFATSFTMRCTY